LPGVTVNGFNASGQDNPGQYFSQSTSGFYSTLPYNVASKLERNYMYLIYSPFNMRISKNIEFHNLVIFEPIILYE
jgi:iron complex outermembrane receptor protein